jgi:hypothetical protein
MELSSQNLGELDLKHESRKVRWAIRSLSMTPPGDQDESGRRERGDRHLAGIACRYAVGLNRALRVEPLNRKTTAPSDLAPAIAYSVFSLICDPLAPLESPTIASSEPLLPITHPIRRSAIN